MNIQLIKYQIEEETTLVSTYWTGLQARAVLVVVDFIQVTGRPSNSTVVVFR